MGEWEEWALEAWSLAVGFCHHILSLKGVLNVPNLGGISYLSPRHGFACDAAESFEVSLSHHVREVPADRTS